MNFDVNRFIEDCKYSEEKAQYLSNFKVVDVLYRKSLDFAYIKAENDVVLPYSIYMDLMNYFKRHGLSNIKLYIKAKEQVDIDGLLVQNRMGGWELVFERG